MEVFRYVDGLVKELMALRNYSKEQAETYLLFTFANYAVNSVTVIAGVEAQMKSIRTEYAIKNAKEKN